MKPPHEDAGPPTVRPVGRKVDVAELVGAAEIAERLGVSLHTVHSWRRRHDDFPAPVAQLRQALVWAWPDVAAWAQGR